MKIYMGCAKLIFSVGLAGCDLLKYLLLGGSGSGKGKIILIIARQLIQNLDRIVVIFNRKIDSFFSCSIRLW
ncbi:MAG: hypothetical protein GKC53_02995 [Neisseriaceae bacterium]|nr:MAG: hypothetical protein GKC53_02995 [Neisseriaceae bacterium]